MDTLVIYDTFYSNTEQVARAIGETLAVQKEVEIRQVRDVNPQQLTEFKLLIVGSPTRGFEPTELISEFLRKIPIDALKGIKVAAFDTRLSIDTIKFPLGRFLARKFLKEYAANLISSTLKEKGGVMSIPPEGFFVKGTKGPLIEGELARAADWARQFLVNGQ
jgi:flavodoxin